MDGDRREHDDRERHTAQAPIPHRGDPQDERQPDRGPAGKPGDEAADPRTERGSPLGRGKSGIHHARRRQRPRRRPRRHDLGRTPQQVQRRLGQLAPNRGDGPFRAPRGGPRHGRGHQRRDEQRRGQRHAGRRHEAPDQQHRRGRHDPDRCVRQRHAEPEIRQPVHVPDQPRQEVARAELGETGRRQPRQPRVRGGAQLREDPERGVVGGEALGVPEHAARDPEGADRGDREQELEHRRLLRRARDQPGRRGREADRGTRCTDAREHREQQATADRAADPEDGEEGAHEAAAGAGADAEAPAGSAGDRHPPDPDGPVRPGDGARPMRHEQDRGPAVRLGADGRP